MYNLKRTSEDTDTLSNGFHQSVQEIKNEFLGFRDNNTRRKLEVKIFYEVVFRFAKRQKSYLWVGIRNKKN